MVTRLLNAQTKPDAATMPTSRQLLRALETMAGVGFGVLSTIDGSMTWTEGLHVLGGVTDSIGKPIDIESVIELLHSDDRPRLREAFQQMMRGALPTHRRFRLVRPDRTLRTLEMKVQQLVDHEHQACGWLVCVTDVTENEGLERIARLEKLRQQALLKHLNPNSVWTRSPGANQVEEVYWTGDATAPAGLTSPECMLARIHPEDRKDVEEAIAAGHADIIRCRVANGPDSYAWTENIRIPVANEEGVLVEWLWISRGLSETDMTATDPTALTAPHCEIGVTGANIRAARALLDWTIPVLSQRADVSVSTIMRIEENSDMVVGGRRAATTAKLVEALASGGVVFQRSVTGKVAVSL